MHKRLRILHCLRAPVGGLFRHVCDLAEEQAKFGYDVGIICDSYTGGPSAQRKLEDLRKHCTLGVHQEPMSRQLGPRDISAYLSTLQLAKLANVDILHGHGAKGGAYARLAANRMKRQGNKVLAFYTPHGGTLHYSRDTIIGRVFLFLEQRLETMTDGLIFESCYSSKIYDEKLKPPACMRRVIPNGVRDEEFGSVERKEDLADFVFVGELRDLKGVHILIEALVSVPHGSFTRVIIVGSGPDEARFKALAQERNLTDRISFPGPMPAREAFALGRCLVVPSLAESFPYIVLEAAAARMPLIVTNVGGIPEIVADSTPMLEAGNVMALAERLKEFCAEPEPFNACAVKLQSRVRENFHVTQMARSTSDFYLDVMKRKTM